MHAQDLLLCKIVARICKCMQNTEAICPLGYGYLYIGHKGRKRMKVHLRSDLIRPHILGKYYNQISIFKFNV
jgi:hypothetical protein